MATKIVMYTGNNCGKCKRAKEMFARLPEHIEVELVEKNVDENEKYMYHLKEVIESNTLPTFIYHEHDKNGNLKRHVLRGFDENIGKIMEVLGL
ncbi:glutaredoxin family protein [Bacillus cereus]|uniref:glutaredoxin family protein n=1 Tax=Bacillus cereus TaxID=1396 RepID=UPI000BF271CB|nr:glutaredoxin domain-containing protein [Bacillus cereus]PFA75856.1 NrdH-redoxin [Bacillus cereus]PGU80075.1 NrdH-redoxin [Bacillus cereus]PGZ66476.1 NrdH-redoxin [Bacillus cereus]